MNANRSPFGLALAAGVWLVLMVGGVFWPLPKGAPRPPPTPLEAPVPLLESTPATLDGGAVLHLVLDHLPPPGPNQLRAGQWRIRSRHRWR